MAVLRLDELNISGIKIRSMPYEQYFGEMDLTEEQKENRIDFSEQMEEIILFIFYLLDVQLEYALQNPEYIEQELTKRYSDLVLNYVNVDDYLEYYIENIALSIVEETEKNYIVPYFLSHDRARFIAENEANTVWNYIEYKKAVDAGYVEKEWRTELDKKVRKTHRKMEHERITIDKPFNVGDSQLMFPKDTSLGAEATETVNCRCTVKYYR